MATAACFSPERHHSSELQDVPVGQRSRGGTEPYRERHERAPAEPRPRSQTQVAHSPGEANRRWTGGLPCLPASGLPEGQVPTPASPSAQTVELGARQSLLIGLPLFPLGKSSLPQTPREEQGVPGKTPSRPVRSAEAEGMHTTGGAAICQRGSLGRAASRTLSCLLCQRGQSLGCRLRRVPRVRGRSLIDGRYRHLLVTQSCWVG